MSVATTNPQAGSERRDRSRKFRSEELAVWQLNRLNEMLAQVLPQNQFLARKLGRRQLQLDSLDQLAELPFTFKDELMGIENNGQFPAHLTYPLSHYVRFHRTSGTRGRPLVVLDTQSDWQWWVDTWQYVLDAAQITNADQAVLAFSFGPFIGFWSAFDALVQRGVLTIPAGGMKTLARLELIRSTQASVLMCTPSYALHLAEVAHANQFDINQMAVRKIVVAGEPGGSVPAIRSQIEAFWKAEVIDHAGASEIGPWGYSDPKRRGLYVIESEFIAEFLSIESGLPANEGELSELVLTTLGRFGSPVLRYRTGDLVRPTWNDDQPCGFVLLSGGVLGRNDDMMIIRGVNVFPSSIEQILRSFPEIIEYRLTAKKRGAMDELTIEIEDRLQDAARVIRELQIRLGLRVDVQCVAMGTLPRFEGKGKRFIDHR